MRPQMVAANPRPAAPQGPIGGRGGVGGGGRGAVECGGRRDPPWPRLLRIWPGAATVQPQTGGHTHTVCTVLYCTVIGAVL